MGCPHEDFVANVDVDRLSAVDGGPIVGFAACLTIRCAVCSESFVFPGHQAGLARDRVTTSIDAAELRVPIRPASSSPDLGRNLPGFLVKMDDLHGIGRAN